MSKQLVDGIYPCTECGKQLWDPQDDPLYVVTLDAYFCNDDCWDMYRGRGEE